MTLIVAGEVLMEKVVKTYALKDIIRHKAVSYKNLYEMCSQYPSKGVGFRVWRKTWPDNCYWTVKEAEFYGPSHGKIFGVLTWNGKVEKNHPIKIRNCLKRGVWKYNVMDSWAKLDNGVSYTAKDMEAYMNKALLKESNLKVYGKEERPQGE